MSSGRTTFSAAAYRRVGQAASAARNSERDASRAERQAEHDAKQNQIRQRVSELADWLFSQLPDPAEIERRPILAGSTMIAFVRPPSKEDADVEVDGRMERAKVPKYPAEQTHFAGYDRATGKLADPEIGGLPLVALLQGFRSKGADGRLGKSDPKTLPDGRTAIDRINELLIASLPEDEDPESCPCIRVHWNTRPRGDNGVIEDGRLEIRLVWDLAAWETWNAKRAEKQKCA